MTQQRPVANDVSPIFTARWSPRAFTGEAIDVARLNTFFEAARWAPSAFNSQPWRFIYARQGGERWADFLGLLNDFNRSWAQHASALVVVASATRFTPPGKSEAIQSGSHAFDTGAAAAYLALQASLAGWHAHAMGGFDKERARSELGVPEGFAVEAVIAIGKLGDPQSLPPGLRERETPSPRQALSAIVAEGRFSFPDTPA
ncbi:MAG: nitroreductase family protein [Zoogloea sp.]|uniref:nitroreductase family protein n=1 Tax=Zoogloea sp. TaxID=49181 RepID=UPI00262E37F7|nr:nitroreductase family protein [Zoogloea sp.]MDD3329372.1 nitroreductase family protein [Zoogloea sp.]